MTFSDPEVAAFINKNFVAAWANRGPGFFNDDLSTEKWIFSGSMEAYPTKNICTFFLAPDGRVFDYVAGSWSPDLFLKSLKTAVELRRALYDDAMKAKDGGVDAARKVHEALAVVMASERDRARQLQSKPDGWRKLVSDSRTYSYRGTTHQHGAGCLTSLMAGYDYLARLHQKWSETAALPELDEIRYAYLWGNSFTEESDRSKSIADSDASKEPDPFASGKPRPLSAPEDVPVSGIRVTPRGGRVETGLPDLLKLSGTR